MPGVVVRVEVLVDGRTHAAEPAPGESWAAAARRLVPDHLAPVALDLSGEVKRFQVDRDVVVALRPMTRGDLPAVTRWRREPHLRRWWAADGEPTTEAVEAAYGPSIDGRTPTRMTVVEVNGRSVGFVQDYLVRDYPEYALLTPDPEAVGLDYAIGDPGWVGRGLGVRLIWAWLLDVGRRFPGASTYFAAPDHRNAPSLRILEKAGFVRGTWFDEPQADGSVATVVGCSLQVRTVLGTTH